MTTTSTLHDLSRRGCHSSVASDTDFIYHERQLISSANERKVARRGGATMTSGSVSRTAALKTLGLSDPCSKAEVSAAYRRLARSMHPDMSGVPDHDVVDRFTSLTDAYRVLTTPCSPASPTPPPTTTPSSPALRLRLAD